jgi:hypothetical protein
MKTKSSRKLTLTKETLKTLNAKDLAGVQSGVDTALCTIAPLGVTTDSL